MELTLENLTSPRPLGHIANLPAGLKPGEAGLFTGDWLAAERSVAAICKDRILDQAHAAGGDVRRLADLFGLSIQARTRDTSAVRPP